MISLTYINNFRRWQAKEWKFHLKIRCESSVVALKERTALPLSWVGSARLKRSHPHQWGGGWRRVPAVPSAGHMEIWSPKTARHHSYRDYVLPKHRSRGEGQWQVMLLYQQPVSMHSSLNSKGQQTISWTQSWWCLQNRAFSALQVAL